ncbi:MAG: sensor histidine kinase [Myxococcales bacterium]
MRARLLTWTGWLAVWTLVALFFATQNYVTYAQYGNGAQPSFGTVVAASLCGWGTWALFTPPILALADRFPLERGRLARSLAWHALAAAALVAVKLWLDAQIRSLVFHRPSRFWLADFHPTLLTYAAIVAGAHLVALRRVALRASQLETGLALARLQALEARLQPHFLFNTLNAISALVHLNPASADRMIGRLGELLRAALKAGAGQEVQLRDEVEFVRGYLEIEQARFPDRLQVDFQVDEAALDARLPSLVLQPLVENAVRHGIAQRATPGRIAISAVHDAGMLRLEVCDDGPGLHGQIREGVGLSATRERLLRLYGPGQRITVDARPGGGVRATLTIPYRIAGEAA